MDGTTKRFLQRLEEGDLWNGLIEVRDYNTAGIDCGRLQRAIAGCANLRWVDLQTCGLEPQCFSAVLAGIAQSESVARLDLVSDLTTGQFDLGAVCEMLGRGTSVRTLYILGDCRQSDCAALRKALQSNVSVEEIHVASGSLTEGAAAEFAALIEENVGVEDLHMHCEAASDAVWPLIFTALGKSCGLKRFGVGTQGFLRRLPLSALADALRLNTTLEELYIGSHSFAYLDLVGVSEALCDNQTLNKLEIYSPSTPSMCVRAASADMRRNFANLKQFVFNRVTYDL